MIAPNPNRDDPMTRSRILPRASRPFVSARVPGATRMLAAMLTALVVGTVAGLPGPVRAQASRSASAADPKGADAQHRRDDVARHRTMATAHEAAARCLESGQKEPACHDALRKACEGVAVGRYCGMKHVH